MGLYLGKEKISNLSVGQTVSYITDISDETTINISGILKGENNKIVPATPGVDYVIPGDSTVTSVNGQTGGVNLTASDVGAVSTDNITQTLGTSTTKVPSEKAVSDAIVAAGGGSGGGSGGGAGGIDIAVQSAQPFGQTVGNFWYQVT